MSEARDKYVYLIHDSTGVPVYVGCGRGNRIYASNRRNVTINALISFGRTLPPVKVRGGMTEAEAFECEKALIAFHGRMDLGLGPLLNLTDGGAGGMGVKKSLEAIEKTAAANRGRKQSAETREKMSAAHRAKALSPERREALTAANRGRIISAATRAKLSAANRRRTGEKRSAETRAKMSASHLARRLPADAGAITAE